jgi:hypothetical protein
MDTIQAVVEDQLKQILSKPVHRVALLQLQNHIYGCFIMMEDLAQHAVSLTDGIVKGTSYQFDMEKQFSMIGLRYGFVQDTKLVLQYPLPCYKEAWLAVFRAVYEQADVEKTDVMEDAIIQVIQRVVPEEESYFLHALETGSLSQEWLEKMLELLLHGEGTNAVTNTVASEVKEEDVKPTILAQAKTEKPIQKSVVKKFAITRRHAQGDAVKPGKKYGTTRRGTKH